MLISARAPGKLVLLGEYAVLAGERALVMAVSSHCRARIGPGEDARCRLETRMPAPEVHGFDPGTPSGAALIDAVIAADPADRRWPVWSAVVDSTAFFSGDRKLGLGSSAAALVAWAGAWATAAAPAQAPPGLEELIRLHRHFQGGAGSGLDVAASLLGGVIDFRLGADASAHVGSVQLPKSVGFAGIFAGHSASTPDLIGRYQRWVTERAAAAGQLVERMGAAANQGYAAAGERDGAAFSAAVAEYGRCLDVLGAALGVDIVTPAHREIGRLAGRFGLAYKVSGAGGGDVGIACGVDIDALAAFSAAAADEGFVVFALAVDEQGLVIEEQVQ